MFCHNRGIRSNIPQLSVNQHSGIEPPVYNQQTMTQDFPSAAFVCDAVYNVQSSVLLVERMECAKLLLLLLFFKKLEH